jgi:uncharacterized protein YjhX (UPF0386 family)
LAFGRQLARSGMPARLPGPPNMDISRLEQRVLHLLAQGGRIEIEKENKRIAEIICLTRDGWRYPGVDLELFRKLRRKKAVSSSDGGPYRITRRGLELVRSQVDNK